jgi:hypothetical protein
MQFDTVKTFSATKAKDRAALGDVLTEWIENNRDKEIVDKIVTQSSDNEFHCLTITLFCRPRRTRG